MVMAVVEKGVVGSGSRERSRGERRVAVVAAAANKYQVVVVVVVVVGIIVLLVIADREEVLSPYL